jgi:hypothetical protein
MFEYIHVLRPPANPADRVIRLPAPANHRQYASATVLITGRAAKLTQDANGVQIDVPWQDTWDPLDTVIKLKVAPSPIAK